MVKQDIEDLKEKYSGLARHIDKFKDLMAMDDSELRIHNSNDYVLNDNEVYNSPDCPEDLKKQLRLRSFCHGFKEQFLERYNSIEELVETKKAEERKAKNFALIRAGEHPNQIPQRVTDGIRALSIYSGHKTDYILKKCEDYRLSLGEMEYLLDLKDTYQTKMPTIFGLLDNDFSIETIQALLEAREVFLDREEKAKTSKGYSQKIFPPSLISMARFTRTFLPENPDSGNIAEVIGDTFEEITDERLQKGKKFISKTRFLGTTLDDLVNIAKNKNMSHLETAIDYLCGRIPLVPSSENDSEIMGGVF